MDMIDFLYKNYKENIHISLGMTNKIERDVILNYIQRLSLEDQQRTVIYHCTSGYPVPFEKLYLLEIQYLRNLSEQVMGEGDTSFEVGFSDHEQGIMADTIAYLLGATYIERHFVDNKTFAHSDACASITPTEMQELCKQLENIQLSAKEKPDFIDPIEQIQRNKLRLYSR